MRITFICVGKLGAPYRPIWKHYEQLLRPYASLEVREISETPLSRGLEVARTKEGAGLAGLIGQGAFTVALDSRGVQYSSEGLSSFLAGKKLHGQSSFQFVVGGPAGLDNQVIARSQVQWSLSTLTFPHQMARCIALEQLYRAARIERGETYHY